MILVDALVRNQAITGAQPLNMTSQNSELQVTVSLDGLGETLTAGNVCLNAINGSATLLFRVSLSLYRLRIL